MNPLLLLSTAALLAVALLGCGADPAPTAAAADTAEPELMQLYEVMCLPDENECDEVATGAPMSPQACGDHGLELAQGPAVTDDQGRELTGLVCRP